MDNDKIISLLNYGKSKKASDIHIKVDNNVFFRIEGDMVKSNFFVDYDLLKTYLEELLTTEENNILNSGIDINKSISVNNIRIRYNVFLSANKPSIAIRLINEEIISLEELDIFDEVIELIEELNGLVLITGISGSGKTMTMNSIVEYINKNYSYNILMLEDPIEFKHKSRNSLINQREVNLDVGSYTEGLKSSLREDPDIIFLGEMRNLDSIKIALTAAETGHLVFSTLHTMGSSKTIDRIIDVFPNNQQSQIRLQVSTVLKAVFSQKLVKEKGRRKAEFEKLIVNNAISNLIRENKTYQIDNISRVNIKR